MRVLLVEDNDLNRRLVRAVLESHEVTEATTVDGAWAELMRSVPDVVLLDVEIPGGGGERLLREIRRDQKIQALPVIAVTALAMRGDRERLLEAGFDGYLSKPIDARTFAAEIQAIVERKRAPSTHCNPEDDPVP